MTDQSVIGLIIVIFRSVSRAKFEIADIVRLFQSPQQSPRRAAVLRDLTVFFEQVGEEGFNFWSVHIFAVAFVVEEDVNA